MSLYHIKDDQYTLPGSSKMRSRYISVVLADEISKVPGQPRIYIYSLRSAWGTYDLNPKLKKIN